ncbi:hypothetical protein [Caballeronia sp. BCC1704]|nr:hypothetical protein [Caballeronia sp. BCC1704]
MPLLIALSSNDWLLYTIQYSMTTALGAPPRFCFLPERSILHGLTRE